MVFKNPYGYLIKHFKMIHLFLTLLYVYLAFKVSSILTYYNHFIDGTVGKLDAISYVNNFYLVAIILSIGICIVVYILMRYKKKPRLLYLLLILFYVVVAVMIHISYQGLHTIYISVLETKTLRLYRDLLSILILFQYASVFVVLVRGLGFDIKKFNFVQDLAELNLEEKDEEEIELALEENRAIGRGFRRKIRELKYYYIENKIFIVLIGIIIAVFLVGGFVFHKEVVDKRYQEGETFSTDEYRFQVVKTLVTNRDVNNNIINQSDKSFVIVKMMIGSNRGGSVFNTSNLILKIGNHSYSSDNKYVARFSDLGNGYKGSVIREGVYLFIYSIDNSDISHRMILEYAKDKVVNLSPVYLDEINNEEKYKINQTIDLSNSAFGSGHFMISSYEIKDKFAYTYQYEALGKTNTATLTISSNNNLVMHLVIDAELPSSYSYFSFLSSLGKLKYKNNNGEEFSSSFNDKTPVSYGDGLYLTVDKNIENASSIWLEITIRNNKYIYTLK